MYLMNKYISIIVALTMLLSCSRQTMPDSTLTDVHVLYIGNSLTYTHDLPAKVATRALKKGYDVKSKSLTYPNYAIEDHWNDGEAQKLIATGQYDYVIMQQGPSSQEYGLTTLIHYGKQFGDLCRQHDTQLAYYMVWPSLMYFDSYDLVISNYTRAAQESGAILLPVGQVWKDHIDKSNDFSYYGPDGFHPSEKGTEKAAEVIVDTIFK